MTYYERNILEWIWIARSSKNLLPDCRDHLPIT